MKSQAGKGYYVHQSIEDYGTVPLFFSRIVLDGKIMSLVFYHIALAVSIGVQPSIVLLVVQ
jgi:hypothetical protein